jgi:hypothetical protein
MDEIEVEVEPFGGGAGRARRAPLAGSKGPQRRRRAAGVQTFLMRVWTPPTREDGAPQLRGFVERVGSGRRRAVHCDQDAVDFLHDCLAGEPAAGAEEPDPEGSQ